MNLFTPPPSLLRYTLITLVLIAVGSSLWAQRSSSVNKLWQSKTAHPSEILDFINSTYDNAGNIFLTGNHTQANGQVVLLLEKFNEAGSLAWSQQWVCTNCYAAFGVDLSLVGNYIYVVGAVQPDVSSFSFDIVVQKYHAGTGNLLWSQILDNNGSANEFPVDIAVNANGTVFVTGTTQQSGNGYDLFTAAYTGSGVLSWKSTYDYAGFDETAAHLRLLSGNMVQVLAASASTATDWEATLLTYGSTGILTDSLRSTSTELDRDLPLNYLLEGNELYVGGSQINPATSNQDAYLKKYALNTGIQEVWTKPIDIEGRAETLLAIQRDMTGDVYATGGTTDAQNDSWTWIQRLEDDGSTIWQRIKAASPAEDILSGRYFSLDLDQNLILAFNYSDNQGQKVHLAQYDSDGNRRWEVPLISSNEKAVASNLLVPNDKFIYVVGIFVDPVTANQFYHINKLEKHEKQNTVVTDSLGNPSHIAEDLLIRFAPCVVDTPFVDNHQLNSGKVSEVITDTALINQMDDLLGAGGTLGDWRLYKVFDTFDTHVTTIKGRQGIDIKAPPLWATFLLEIDAGAQVKEPPAVKAALDTIGRDKIRFSHPNYIGRSPSPPPPPDDLLYGNQASLFTSASGINMEPAWDILDEPGESNWELNTAYFEDNALNIVLMDTGVRFQHDDLRCLGCPGIVPPGETTPSIVVEALGFPSGGPVMDLSSDDADTQDVWGALESPGVPTHGHGTRAAGIISAIRNNAIGVAGITSNTKNTVQLHSYRAAEFQVPATISADISVLGFVLNCENDQGVPCDEDVDLDLLCLERYYVPDGNFPEEENTIEAYREAIELVYDAQYVQSTARGNDGETNPTIISYPATYEDRWMISVGASGRGVGEIVENGINTSNITLGFPPDNYSSNYGLEMDVTAPGINQLVYTTSNLDNNSYYYFNGTSAALPHVTGTAAQVMLHHRGPLAQEDVERLLEYTTSDVATPGYDQKNGWGRVNAGNAIKFIDPDEDDHRVVQVDIVGDLPVNNDPFGCGDDCYIYLDRPENDLEDFQNGAYYGTIRKYSYEFAIDVSLYGFPPGPLADPAMKPVWVRSSATNLWFTPDDINGDKLFVPDNHLFFEGEPFFDGNILRGIIAGYAFTIRGDTNEEPIPLICDGNKITASTQNPVDLNECYYGAPRLTFSFLVQDPINEDNLIITDVVTPVDPIGQRINIYPNPTTGICQIGFSINEREDVIIELYNLAGQQLQSQSLSIAANRYANTALDLSTYPAGMYMLRVHTNQGVLTQKIIKQ